MVPTLYSPTSNVDDFDPCASFTVSRQEAFSSHALTVCIPPYSYAGKFYGVMIDSGCDRGSSGGHSQYLEYCKATVQKPQINPTRARHCQLGIGSEIPQDTALIQFPICTTWLSFGVHAIASDVSILLGLPHMDRQDIYINDLDDRLVHQDKVQFGLTTRQFGHAFVQGNPHIVCHCTDDELRRLHRRFEHPSLDKLHTLLERANIDSVTTDTRHALAKIEREWRSCQTYAQRPRRFKFYTPQRKEL